MDRNETSVLTALAEHQKLDRYGFTPPAHRQGRGVDPQVLDFLGGLQPRWIRPSWDNELKLAHPPTPREVEAMWEKYPDASAALIVSPTPYGTCADIEAIAKICHNRGKPLIIDEAWGAQLPFHSDTPTGPCPPVQTSAS
jgi:arginine/lysine/ornithine decarboxylase